MKQMKLSPPGSDAAIAMSCCCPVLDNAHGHGYMGQQGIYVINGNCPLHIQGCEIDILANPNDYSDFDDPLDTFYKDCEAAADESVFNP